MVEVTNTISKDQGYLKISKVFSDPAYSGTFAIDYLCTDATPTSGTVNLNGGATSAAIGPIDTHNGDTAVTCTATEQSLPSVTGYTWGDASYSGNGPTITKGDAASAPVVEVTNTISKDQGYLKISKVFSDPAYSGTFAIDYLCTDATPTSGTVNLNGGATSAAIGPIDTHNGDTAVTCTATEQSLPSVTGYTWGDASYSGNGPTITKGDAASAPVVEVTNTISKDQGYLKISKVFSDLRTAARLRSTTCVRTRLRRVGR